MDKNGLYLQPRLHNWTPVDILQYISVGLKTRALVGLFDWLVVIFVYVFLKKKKILGKFMGGRELEAILTQSTPFADKEIVIQRGEGS